MSGRHPISLLSPIVARVAPRANSGQLCREPTGSHSARPNSKVACCLVSWSDARPCVASQPGHSGLKGLPWAPRLSQLRIHPCSRDLTGMPLGTIDRISPQTGQNHSPVLKFLVARPCPSLFPPFLPKSLSCPCPYPCRRKSQPLCRPSSPDCRQLIVKSTTYSLQLPGTDTSRPREYLPLPAPQGSSRQNVSSDRLSMHPSPVSRQVAPLPTLHADYHNGL